MPLNLPTDLLRSFVAIIDSGSMLKATERVFVTQSALSLQMKRLEEMVQANLFRRDGRRLTLSAQGTALLGRAREILALNDRAVAELTGDGMIGPVRLGVGEDFAETVLPGLLGAFSGLHPELQLQVRVGNADDLLEQLHSDRLDVVLSIGADDDPAAIRSVPMLWHGDPSLANEETLPIALLEAPCRFRDAAIRALNRSERPCRIMFETPSLAALRAAVDAGLALTCRTDLFRPCCPPIRRNDLPSLPSVTYVRHVRRSPHAILSRLGDLIDAAIP